MSKAKLNRLLRFLCSVFNAVRTHIRRSTDALTTFWRHHNQTILLILLVATATVLITVGISAWLGRFRSVRFPSVGTMYTIGVKAYEDLTLQHEVTETYWGTIYAGTTNDVTIYIRSISNIKTTLELETANWTFLNTTNATVWGPSNTTYDMNITWNYNNTPLSPDQTIPVTLSLHVDNSTDFIRFLIDNRVTQFRFDIIIRANPA